MLQEIRRMLPSTPFENPLKRPMYTETHTKPLDHHNYPHLADREKIDRNRVLAFVLAVAVGATACAGTILDILA